MANEGLIKKGIQSFNKIAEDIAGSEYWKKVAPGMEQLQREVGERIATSGGKATALFDESQIVQASKRIAGVLSGIQGKPTSGDEFDKLAENIAGKIKSATDIDKIFKEHESLFGGKDWKPAAENIKKNMNASGTANTPEQAYKEASILTKLTETPKAYFTHPDKATRNARIGTAVAGYTVATVGGRYLSGGSLTRDSYGRNDIAGVPFI